MVIELSTLTLSVLSSIGVALLLVEKREDFPVNRIHSYLRSFIDWTLGYEWAAMLNCTVCTSFWASALVELYLYWLTDGKHFCWPLTGFATAGILYLVIDTLNIIDRQK
jgi:hypothetical protein